MGEKKDQELISLEKKYKTKHFEYIDKKFKENWKPMINSALQYALKVETRLLDKQDELDYDRDIFCMKRSEYYMRFQEQRCLINLVRNCEKTVRKRADTYEECLENYLARIHELENIQIILNKEKSKRSNKILEMEIKLRKMFEERNILKKNNKDLRKQFLKTKKIF